MTIHDIVATLDPKHGIHVDGVGLGAVTTFDVQDPATLEIIAEVADATQLQATAAVDAAARALPA